MEHRETDLVVMNKLHQIERENSDLKSEVKRLHKLVSGDCDAMDNALKEVMQYRGVSDIKNFIKNYQADNIFDVLNNLYDMALMANNIYTCTIYKGKYILITCNEEIAKIIVEKAGWEGSLTELLSDLKEMDLLFYTGKQYRRNFSMCCSAKTVYDISGSYLINIKKCRIFNVCYKNED